MDKVYIKPTSREILIKDSLKEGYFDIYSYDYHSDEHKRNLGSLYIIGNVNQTYTSTQKANVKNQEIAPDDAPDVAYMINLIASLAKREYYSKPNLLPREAFTVTLKKINEIVDEFFKNRNTKINIGVFAVTGEEILISKLGKFKIILSRDNQTVDILNNITLFNKEHVEEKEFSNIITGKIYPGDKLLAFYPSRFIVSREKLIRDHFVKLSWADFIDKIHTIKSNRLVSCAALYIDIHKVKEPAKVHRLQPHELKPKKPDISDEDVQLANSNNSSSGLTASTAIEVGKDKLPPGDIHDSKTNQKPEPINRPVPPIIEPDMPKIIPSEFSSAKKETIFDKLISKLRSFRRDRPYGRIHNPAFIFKKQIAIAVPIIVLLAIGGWLAKSYIFISAEVKEQRRVAKQIEVNIKLAQEKIDANDIISARQLLLSSLSESFTDGNQDLLNLLDKADNAVQANPVLVEQLPDEVIKKAAALDIELEKIKSGKYNTPSPVNGLDIYEGNLYVLAADKIFKIIDAAKGSSSAISWLKEDAILPTVTMLIAVDGNIYVMDKAGIITKYFRGEKVTDFNSAILAENSVMMTAKDIPGLYIINKKLGRVYIIDKESGTIIKTLKIGNTESLSAVYLDNAGIVYTSTQDGKYWKIE